jgi:hypothetical protein
MRFSIANVMIAVAIIGGGFAALSSPTKLAMAIVFLAVVVALLAATLGAIYSRGQRRAFYLGAALFGGVYMMLAFASLFDAGRYAIDAPIRELQPAFRGITPAWTEWDTFRPIAHCLVAVMLGLAGGLIGRAFFERSSASRAQAP